MAKPEKSKEGKLFRTKDGEYYRIVDGKKIRVKKKTEKDSRCEIGSGDGFDRFALFPAYISS